MSAAAVERTPGGAVTTAGDIVIVEGVSRTYGVGSATVHAARDVHLRVPRGQLLAIRGRSGSGKTTLLNLIGGLDKPTAGRVIVDGVDVTAAGESGLVALRRDVIGFIFQTFGLIPVLSAAENVGLPMRLKRMPVAARDERTEVLLDLVGLGGHVHQRPHELSGGQQQRVAIARSLANVPHLLLADEPTGQLDTETGQSIMRLLRTVITQEGMTGIVATHDPMMIELADRVITLSDGAIVDDVVTQKAGT